MIRRVATALAVTVAAAVAAPGCVAVLGVPDPPSEDVVHTFCGCREIHDLVPNCDSVLGSRLSLALEQTRTDWLASYARDCSHCPDSRRCYYLAPMCTHSHDACTKAEECCSFVTQSGACDDHDLCR